MSASSLSASSACYPKLLYPTYTPLRDAVATSFHKYPLPYLYLSLLTLFKALYYLSACLFFIKAPCPEMEERPLLSVRQGIQMRKHTATNLSLTFRHPPAVLKCFPLPQTHLSPHPPPPTTGVTPIPTNTDVCWLLRWMVERNETARVEREQHRLEESSRCSAGKT